MLFGIGVLLMCLRPCATEQMAICYVRLHRVERSFFETDGTTQRSFFFSVFFPLMTSFLLYSETVLCSGIRNSFRNCSRNPIVIRTYANANLDVYISAGACMSLFTLLMRSLSFFAAKSSRPPPPQFSCQQNHFLDTSFDQKKDIDPTSVLFLFLY